MCITMPPLNNSLPPQEKKKSTSATASHLIVFLSLEDTLHLTQRTPASSLNFMAGQSHSA